MNLRLLLLLIVREWRHHPWRHGAALMAVALGVALAYSVHLINSSALEEFSSAVRTANGQPDLTLRGRSFDDALFERIAADPAVQLASPVLEVDTMRAPRTARRWRCACWHALLATPMAPALLPRPASGEDRLAFLDPQRVFANPMARERLGLRDGDTVALQSGPTFTALRLAGSVATSGAPMFVMDLAGAQLHLGLIGKLTRIDLRLAPGTDRSALLARLALPPDVGPVAADEAEQRVSNLSRAYRVNLTYWLVALFVRVFGGLAVGRTARRFAGVLGPRPVNGAAGF
jgi:putative ABC transport system permease protein